MKCLRNLRYPCGKCAACLKNKVEDWKFRMKAEAFDSMRSFFLTLTYDEENRPHEGVRKTHLQSFFKRLRSYGYTFKYYAISEYGPTTLRPHYHMCLFFPVDVDINKLYDDILLLWHKGNITLDEVNDQRIEYVCNYHVTKGFVPSDQAKNFKLSSSNLGLSFLTENRVDFFRSEGDGRSTYLGYRKRLPRYYKDKLLLTDEENERTLPPPPSDVINVPSDFKMPYFSRCWFSERLHLKRDRDARLEYWNKKVINKIINKKNHI